MSIRQFAKALVEEGNPSPLLEALQRLRMASLDQLKNRDATTADPEWAIWNQPPAAVAQPTA